MTILKTSKIRAGCVLALACAAAPALADTGLTGFTGPDGFRYVYDSALGVTWFAPGGASDLGFITWWIANATWFGLPAGSWHMGTLDMNDSVHDRICGDPNPHCTVWSTSFNTWATNLGGFFAPPYPYPQPRGTWWYQFSTGEPLLWDEVYRGAMAYYPGNLMSPPIPEPATAALLLVGLMALGAAARRER